MSTFCVLKTLYYSQMISFSKQKTIFAMQILMNVRKEISHVSIWSFQMQQIKRFRVFAAKGCQLPTT